MSRSADRRYTPQEVAALAGLRLQLVQNAITERKLGRTFKPDADGRRRVDLPALLAFATATRLGGIRIPPASLYRTFRRLDGLPRGPVEISPSLSLDAPKLLAPVLRNLELYETGRKRIVGDPAVMGGLPTIKGTRVPARTLHARIKGGDSIDSILDDYPYLDRETVEAAFLYVEANPERGRPRRHSPPKG